MLKNKRHSEILEILKNEGFAEVRSLGERLYASQPTIRRDLSYLERNGYVKRSHGGAVLADDKINTPISFRRGTKTREKAQICRLAATLIPAGSLIFADDSTTASYLADIIEPKDNITVVTNGYSLCRALVQRDIRVFSTGGRLLKNSEAFVGNIAQENIKNYNAGWLFFSSSSLSRDGIISDYSEEETALRLTMYARAEHSVFLCDSTKFEKSSAFCTMSLKNIDYIVCDAPLPEELLSKVSFSLAKRDGQTFMYKNDSKISFSIDFSSQISYNGIN